MSDLRTLFPDSRYNIVITQTNPLGVLYVGNTAQSPNNGGCCCLWTVPTGATWAKFEVWGGGGPGGGSCCCMQPQGGGGAGSYARRTIRVVPGQTYTICAGGSTCCYSACQAPNGNPSYACNGGATYPLNLCASGGIGGYTQCFTEAGGCYHCVTCICGSACGHDFALCGSQPGSHNTSCGFDGWHHAAEPTYIGGGIRVSFDHCQNQVGDGAVGFPSFPGGGGGGAITQGGNCYCGGVGAGGLVIVTYK